MIETELCEAEQDGHECWLPAGHFQEHRALVPNADFGVKQNVPENKTLSWESNRIERLS